MTEESYLIWETEQAEAQRKRAEDWQRAVDRLSITFEAQHGGGYPDCLRELTPNHRLNTLRALGFRIVEQYTIDVSAPGKPPECQPWARISGKIAVNLADGWVCQWEG